MMRYSIYVVDDEPGIQTGISIGFKIQYQVTAFGSAESALASAKKHRPDLVLLDIGLPGMNGLEALCEFKKIDPNILIIMITAYGDIGTVVSAMKMGAYDYVTKPLQMETLRSCVKNALDTLNLQKEIQLLQERYIRENLPCFIGESNIIQDVIRFVDKVAKSPDTPVLIFGESGTGKELIAHAIHYKSPNFRGPFITLNCASIPKHLIESELFGYESGAFSGATTGGKKGLVEEAADGTLFLDGINDLSVEAQAKLLRFLEFGEFYKVGGTKKKRVCTRILSATNENLLNLIEDGLFRLDLYYRLAVIRIEIPSLNERPEDIIPIASYFLDEFSQKNRKKFSGFSQKVKIFLTSHQWKGNIRELRNLIERGVIVGDGPVMELHDLGLEGGGAEIPFKKRQKIEGRMLPSLPDEGIDLGALEEHFIAEAHRKARGNDVKAAELLRMNYYSFRYRRKKLLRHP